MSFGKLIITSKGRALLAKVAAGTSLKFTAIKMGNGDIGSQAPEALTDVISEIVKMPISSISTGGTYTTISGNFKNTSIIDDFKGDGSTLAFKLSAMPTSLISVTVGGVTTTAYTYSKGVITFTTAPGSGAAIVVTYNLDGFYWKEVGIFASDPDQGEILFSYQNAYTLAEYIASASSETVEKVVSASFLFASGTTVTAEVDPSVNFLTKAEGGDITTLKTKDKSSLVKAVNEVRDDMTGNYDPTLIAVAASLYSLTLSLGASFGGKAYYDVLGADAFSCLGALTAASNLAVGTAYTIGTLPSGYEPSNAITDHDVNGNLINISTAGVITLTPAAAILSGSPLYFYVEW